ILGPPLAQTMGLLAGGLAQQQEIIGGAEARMFEQLVGATALAPFQARLQVPDLADRKSTRLNSSHVKISYAVFCLKKKNSNIEDARADAVGMKHVHPVQLLAGADELESPAGDVAHQQSGAAAVVAIDLGQHHRVQR